MKSLLWKELRQLAPWSAAMLLAMSSIMIGSLISEADRYYQSFYRQAWFQVWVVIVFGAPCVAFVIGVLQTVLEARRDQWAFLLHRGLSATQVFAAKAVTGLAAYAVVTLIPTVIGIVWCAWGGIERQPLSWYHWLPHLASWLASLAFYFAALIAVVWKGPWYFSRLLPLVSPFLMSIGVVGYASEISEYVPIRVFVAIVLALSVLSIAAWGVFVRSGESVGRGALANFCLGVPVFVAIFGGCLCLFAAAGAGYEWLGHRYEWDDAWRSRPFVHFTTNRDAHILQVTTRLIREGRIWEDHFSSIIDLDEPQSNRYASVVGQSRKVATKNPAWDPLELGTMYDYAYGPFEYFTKQDSPRQILENIGSTVASDRLNWIFSSADGWIYGYSADLLRHDGQAHVQPPSLDYVIGPDGFCQDAERPQRRFGKLLAHSGNPWRPRSQFIWHDLLQSSGRGSGDSGQFVLLFDDGLYLIDTAERVVRPVVASREDRKIRCLTKVGDEVAVVYNESIAVHSPLPVSIGTRKDEATAGMVDNMIDVPGELLYSFPIPPEVARFNNFSFGRLPDSGNIVFIPRSGISTFDLHRFIEMRPDGSIVRSRDFLQPNPVPQEAVPPLSAVAMFAPLGPVLAAIAINEVEQAVHGDAPGTCGRLFRALPLGMLLPTAVLLASALGCRWSAGRTARRYGFDARTRRTWQWTAGLFGPAALLTLWFLRDWPARERCRACSARRPVDQERCPQCLAPAAPAPVDGTEILVYERSLENTAFA